jgi:hypothetical protein
MLHEVYRVRRRRCIDSVTRTWDRRGDGRAQVIECDSVPPDFDSVCHDVASWSCGILAFSSQGFGAESCELDGTKAGGYAAGFCILFPCGFRFAFCLFARPDFSPRSSTI